MSGFKPYPAYKYSGVEWLGEVPEHWALTPIKHLALLNPRKSEFDGDTGQNCSFIPMEKLKTGSLLLDEERPVSEVIDGYTYFEDGDVLQAKVTPCFENKNVAVARGLTNGVGFGSSEINVLRPCANISAEFLYYRVQEDSYMGFCTASMIGAGGLKRVPSDIINNFKIAAPELAEQTQIARFLDHETARIDALIEEQQRLIELLKEKRQAVISHAVTKGLDPSVTMKDSGVEWLGEVPAHWEVTKFKWPLRTASGGTPPSNDREAYYDGGIPWLRSLDLTDDLVTEYEVTVTHQAIEETSCKIVPKNSVLIAMYGGDGTIGKNGLLTFDSAINQAICAFLPSNRCSPEYLHRYVQFYRPYWMIGAESSRKDPNIGQDRIGDHFLTLPPLQEQLDIVGFTNIELLKLSALVNEAQTGVELLQERRSVLISAAVTGKIDLRGWQPPASTTASIHEQETV